LLTLLLSPEATPGSYLKRLAPRQSRAAESGEAMHSRTKSPKTKNHASEDDCTNERPDKYDEPSAPSQGASNDAEHSTGYSREL
jgi:hypothetical protein